MVKTEGDIMTAVYKFVMETELAEMIDGVVYKSTDRLINSRTEDIVIKPLANLPGQKQEGYLNINIYVPDKMFDGQYTKNGARCDELERVAVELFEVFDVEDIRFSLESQHTYDSEQAHLINNRILYKLINEE